MTTKSAAQAALLVQRRAEKQRRCPEERVTRVIGAAAFLLAEGKRRPGWDRKRQTDASTGSLTAKDNDMTTKTDHHRPRGLNRRSFLKAGASTAALLGAASTQFPFGAHVAEAAGPEVTKATLGFIALTD